MNYQSRFYRAVSGFETVHFMSAQIKPRPATKYVFHLVCGHSVSVPHGQMGIRKPENRRHCHCWECQGICDNGGPSWTL
jgi:hypothetical protein